MLWIIVVFSLLLFAIPQLIGYAISEKGYRGPVTDHYDGKRFYNYGDRNTRNLWHVLKWMLTRDRGPWEFADAKPGPTPSGEIGDHIRITHVNHSTFLIQCDNVNILTDPVWSERVSPFRSLGPKRMRPPGIRIEDLPAIHVILLSHNHYDHLDLTTLKLLVKKHEPHIIVPLGVDLLLKKHGIGNITVLDWWQTVSAKAALAVQALPAHHASARGSFDRDKTLWCGFSIAASRGKIYFAGDTGYHAETFNRIGVEAGPFRVSIIPIGASRPVWFMSPVHCTPYEAVQIHLDVKSEQSIACHFGTFPLGDDSQHGPARELEDALHQRNIDKKFFIVPNTESPIEIHPGVKIEN
jgi:L-ascorbate metabolism protein UlaG (beta-lactamase superfamily)